MTFGYQDLPIVSMLIALLAVIPAHAMEKADEKRLDEVAKRGTHVMPFDLEKTTHVFSKISEDFKRGDFSKPERIHGEGMPGLAALKSAKPGQIRIEYSVLPDGAQIAYSTKSPHLIDAIHYWFDAQLRDHARHAVPGSPHQHIHLK